MPPLITQSRNRKIQPGAEGYLDASLTATILEIPRGQITAGHGRRASARQPPLPARARATDGGVAKAIQQKLTQQSPDDAAYFAERYDDFDMRLGCGGRALGRTHWHRIAA